MWSWLFHETNSNQVANDSEEVVKLITTPTNVQKLPALPFVYDYLKPRLFICKHPDFLFASIITDMDYRLLQYIGNNCSTYVSKVLNYVSTSEELTDIVNFTTLFESADRLYDGLSSVGIMDFLNEIRPDLCSSNHYNRLLEDTTVHFNSWYGAENTDFPAEGLSLKFSIGPKVPADRSNH